MSDSEERAQALEQWRQGKEGAEKEDEIEPREGPPVIHLFTEEQEERFGVGPSTEKPFNPDDFTLKGVR